MKYLLLGLGVGNLSIEKYFMDNNNLLYDIYDDNKFKWNINLRDFDIIIKSSGIKNNHLVLKKAKRLKKEIITDIELFGRINGNTYKDVHNNFVVVTGSNGKTTTVNLLKNLINNSLAVGNIGKAIFEGIDNNNLIIEASSFMLEYVSSFRASYNVFLNLYSTHLDHHGTFAKYVNSKLNLIRHLKEDDYIIYNYDDLLLRRLMEVYVGIKVPFSLKEKVNGVYLHDNDIYYQDKRLIDTKSINMFGEQNIQNTMAALAVVCNYPKREVNNYKNTLKQFCVPPYRQQLVGKYNNVLIYNDSKATNFFALSIALKNFPLKRVVLITGGKLRTDDYSLLSPHLRCLTKVYCYGEMGPSFKKYFENYHINTKICNNLEEAINILDFSDCDVILFSPGASSYDQYTNFEVRGDHFNELIKKRGTKMFL